jgi:hypothetical protein
MTAAAAIKRVNLLDVLGERAEVRALLWSIGELTLHEAVDKSALKVLEIWGLLRGTSS